ncbi:hypothetical protein C9374_005651 [Naegleria lovaniensis]|uniref:DUF4116 domain-containing protein n=1 Tax=Naegleria lovaniensis TaxID=51637 RepID=A0AA88KHJ8_NAELO|nr:uncharacterized protein C9374_005651 [Naegleria lovaniensis]KAG2381859.1 hypothetical protein C9374_005651 [Naegleria lovaniensis]
MFSSNPSNTQATVLDDDDFVFNLTDFEFNANLAETIKESRPEFSKSIQYRHREVTDINHDQHHLSEDYWLYVSEFIPLFDFNRFCLVCTAFSEIMTYNRRYLVLKKISKDYKSVLISSPNVNADSIIALTVERSPSDDPNFSKALQFDIFDFLIRTGKYQRNLFKYLKADHKYCDLSFELTDDIYLRPLQEDTIFECIEDFKHYTPERLLDDKEFILKKAFKASRESPNCYIALSTRLRSDKDVMIAAMKHNGALLNHIPYGATIDNDVLKAVLSCKPSRNHLLHNEYGQGIRFSKLRRHVLYHYFSRGEMIDREILRVAFKKEKLNVVTELVAITKLPKDIMLDALQVTFFTLRNFKMAYQLLEKYFYAYFHVGTENVENVHLDPYGYFYNNFREPMDGMEGYPPFRKWNMMEIVERLMEKDHGYFKFFMSDSFSAPTIQYLMRYMKSGRMAPALAKHILCKTLESKCVDETAKKMASDLVTFAFSDKSIVTKMVSFYPKLFSQLPEELKTHSTIIHACLPYTLDFVPENERTEEFYLKVWNKQHRLFYRRSRDRPKLVHDIIFSTNVETGKLIVRDHVLKYSNFLRYLQTAQFDGVSNIEDVITPSQVVTLLKSSPTRYVHSLHNVPHMSHDEVIIELVKISVHNHFSRLYSVDPDLIVPLITKDFIIRATFTYNPWYSSNMVRFLWDRDMIVLKKIFERTGAEKLNKEIAESLVHLVSGVDELVELVLACPKSLQYFSDAMQNKIGRSLETNKTEN